MGQEGFLPALCPGQPELLPGTCTDPRAQWGRTLRLQSRGQAGTKRGSAPQLRLPANSVLRSSPDEVRGGGAGSREAGKTSQLTEQGSPKGGWWPAPGQLCEGLWGLHAALGPVLWPLLPRVLQGGGGAQALDAAVTVLHGLPPQCWSSSYPSSQGCSASWTTSTSATPLWRRRWPWPPSCRTCNPSQVSHQPAAQSFSGTLSNSLGPAGRRKPKPHSMAIKLSSWSNQSPHPLQALSTTSLVVLLVLLHPEPSTNSYNTHATHTHVHTTTTLTHTHVLT